MFCDKKKTASAVPLSFQLFSSSNACAEEILVAMICESFDASTAAFLASRFDLKCPPPLRALREEFDAIQQKS